MGAVVTYVSHGASREGFDAEWRVVHVLTLEGDMINRCEVFDEPDLDAALARFDELQPQAPRLENAASQAAERFQAHFAARDWDAMRGHSDRRPLQRRSPPCRGRRHQTSVGMHDRRPAGGHRHGHECDADVIATRGGGLRPRACPILARPMREPEPFLAELLQLVEIDAGDRITAYNVRPQRHRRRLRGTRRPLPRWRSRRPRARMDGRRAGPSGLQPTRNPPDDGGLRGHRSSAG